MKNEEIKREQENRLGILAENEKKADHDMVRGLLAAAGGAAVLWVLNLLVFSIADQTLMNRCMPFAVCLFALPFFWKDCSKYISMLCFLLGIGILTLLLPVQSLLAWSCPVLISCHYYDPRFTRDTCIGTLVVMFFSFLGSSMLEQRQIASDRIVYLYLPAAVVLLVVYVISSTLSRRTHGLLRKQAEIIQERERMDAELEVARQIQISALPGGFPVFGNREEFEIYASMDAAKEVGGDFYDFYLVDERHLAVVIADVSGKGIGAALFMMRGKTLLRDHTDMDSSLGEVFAKVNDLLCELNSENLFITAFEGILDLETGEFCYVNAGHNPPLLRRRDGAFAYLEVRPGFILGGMEGIPYMEQRLQLEEGDELFLYTDGVTEAFNAADEMYGTERLQTVLNAAALKNAQEICDTVRSDVDRFGEGVPQSDDITMLSLKYRNKGDRQSKACMERTVDAVVENIAVITEFVEEYLEQMDCPAKVRAQIDIAIDEICGNIAYYAYAPKTGPVTVRIEPPEEPREIRLAFLDRGTPFDPTVWPDPDTSLPAEERQIGGLGIYLLKQSMDGLSYEYKNGQNILTIRKLY